jgi:type IV secretory pathway VirJ component
MVNRAGWRFGASFLVLSLIVGPAAFAATDNAGQETPSQTEQDSKSYLPPWMQGQGGGEKAAAPANAAAPAATPATTTESKSTAAPTDDDAMKRKARAGQGRKSHRYGSPVDFMGGFVGLFGR